MTQINFQSDTSRMFEAIEQAGYVLVEQARLERLIVAAQKYRDLAIGGDQ